MKFSARNIPELTLQSIRDYVLDGLPPGDFLQAVLENKLVESFNRADDYNFAAMPHIAWYMSEVVPIACRGNAENVRTWIKNGGLREEPEARAVVAKRLERELEKP